MPAPNSSLTGASLRLPACPSTHDEEFAKQMKSPRRQQILMIPGDDPRRSSVVGQVRSSPWTVSELWRESRRTASTSKRSSRMRDKLRPLASCARPSLDCSSGWRSLVSQATSRRGLRAWTSPWMDVACRRTGSYCSTPWRVPAAEWLAGPLGWGASVNGLLLGSGDGGREGSFVLSEPQDEAGRAVRIDPP